MISITIARISPDLSEANIFLSIFPIKDPKDTLEIKKAKRVNSKKLGEASRNLENCCLYLDDSAAYFEEIDRLLKK